MESLKNKFDFYQFLFFIGRISFTKDFAKIKYPLIIQMENSLSTYAFT